MRTAEIERNTLETQISVSVNLDGSGEREFKTGLPFLDHMLDQVARHGLLDITVKADGDLSVEVSDVGRQNRTVCTVFRGAHQAGRSRLSQRSSGRRGRLRPDG